MSLDKVADKFVAEYEKRRADLGPKTFTIQNILCSLIFLL